MSITAQQQLDALVSALVERALAATLQGMSDSLWALSQLAPEVPAAGLGSLLERFMQLMPQATPRSDCGVCIVSAAVPLAGRAAARAAALLHS